MTTLHYIIKLGSLHLYKHITPFSKQEGDSNSTYMN